MTTVSLKKKQKSKIRKAIAQEVSKSSYESVKPVQWLRTTSLWWRRFLEKVKSKGVMDAFHRVQGQA